eukprot:scaffold1403_cov180-Ochromonas_danica.AAC.25
MSERIKKATKPKVKPTITTNITSHSNQPVQTYRKVVNETVEESMQDILQRLKKKSTSVSSHKDIRDRLIEKVLRLTGDGTGSFGQQQTIVIGFNALCRALKKNTLSVICMAKKANDNALQFLLEGSLVRKVPLVILPVFSSSLKEALKVHEAFCFGVVRSETLLQKRGERKEGQEKEEEEEEEEGSIEMDSHHAAVDDLRDFLLGLAV